ncbi:MAG: choice-of-anchor D domain-containing protein, partial [Bacteroidota bacterium]
GGADGGLFTLSKTSFNLVQNVPQTFTVRLRATVIGAINAGIGVNNVNRCGAQVVVPLKYTRRTELDYSKGRMKLDTLYVGCQERTWSEDTVSICNNTGRPMKVDSVRLGDTAFKWRPGNPGQPLPYIIPNGACWPVIVRLNMGDTTKTLRDTLKVYSDDRCPGSGIIPIVGNWQEVLVILAPDGVTRVDSMKFEDVCPGQISNVQLYQYRSLVLEPLPIDTIAVSPGFFGRRNSYPVILAPKTAYLPTFVRFRPDRPGPFTGTMQFHTSFRGCTIVKTIYLTGRGISVDVSFDVPLFGFGNVTVGKISQQTVTVTNHGTDRRTMSAYLKVGDVFTIVAGGGFTVDPGKSSGVLLQFRPREPITYYDTLCVFDNQCFQTICIPISGTGVFDALSFDPAYLKLDNVIGCQCRTGTIKVKNNTSAPVSFSWTKNDATGKFTVMQLIPTTTLSPGQQTEFSVEYCPDDVTDDRADQAYIDVKLSDGQIYQVLLRANSVAPKLYVTPLSTFGTVESGWKKRDSILVENQSAVPIKVISTSVPPGYTVIGTNPPLPVTLNPRDSLWVTVELAPTAEIDYNGPLTLRSDNPCDSMSWSGQLTGKGTVVKLDVPVSLINYGLIKPCDCAVREIPLPNHSNYIPITVDSVWVDGAGVPNALPAVFVWKSRQTGGSVLPYVIAPQNIDTLLVSFCPNIPAIQQNLLTNGVLHIKAHTPGWNQEFKTTLSGRRELNFQPNRILVSFPNTRVDTSATAIPVDITVPDEFQNPSGDSVVITGITFVPDQRVFSITAKNGTPPPWVIRRGEKFTFNVGFVPRAPKDYVARLNIRTSFPCDGVDTTVLVKGSGFAPAFGLQMAFDTAAIGLDTFHLNTCDTLSLPIMINRAIPQSIIDIAFRIGYDSLTLQLLDVKSPYTTNGTVSDTGDGARAYLKDARNAQAGEIAIVRFTVKGGATSFPIKLDEIDFDSDSLVFFKIIAGIDKGWVIVDEPMISISGLTTFDTVNIRDCADRQVVVRNPGAIPVSFDSLRGLPPGHTVAASSVPLPTTIAPGDSVLLTVRFCPFMEKAYDSSLLSISTIPCPIADTGMIHSFGFAPPYPTRFLFDANPGVVPIFNGTIADTITIPILLDRDIPQTPLDVMMAFHYNRRALQFLDIKSPYSAKTTATGTTYGLHITIPHSDTLHKGVIAQMRFVVAVPDSVNSDLFIVPLKFASDTTFFIKLDPPLAQGDSATMRVDPKCNISRLNFRGGANKLSPPTPNPAGGRVAIEAEFFEDAHARLRIFNSAGAEVETLLDGSQILTGGRYRFEFDTRSLPSGEYFYMLEAGRFRATEQLRIVR